eukprot:scaffold4189_cov378-Prasinococcus_capsulatus_cf.AAC.1
MRCDAVQREVGGNVIAPLVLSGWISPGTRVRTLLDVQRTPARRSLLRSGTEGALTYQARACRLGANDSARVGRRRVSHLFLPSVHPACESR